jgi:hypothetical protein
MVLRPRLRLRRSVEWMVFRVIGNALCETLDHKFGYIIAQGVDFRSGIQRGCESVHFWPLHNLGWHVGRYILLLLVTYLLFLFVCNSIAKDIPIVLLTILTCLCWLSSFTVTLTKYMTSAKLSSPSLNIVFPLYVQSRRHVPFISSTASSPSALIPISRRILIKNPWLGLVKMERRFTKQALFLGIPLARTWARDLISYVSVNQVLEIHLIKVLRIKIIGKREGVSKHGNIISEYHLRHHLPCPCDMLESLITLSRCKKYNCASLRCQIQ